VSEHDEMKRDLDAAARTLAIFKDDERRMAVLRDTVKLLSDDIEHARGQLAELIFAAERYLAAPQLANRETLLREAIKDAKGEA